MCTYQRGLHILACSYIQVISVAVSLGTNIHHRDHIYPHTQTWPHQRLPHTAWAGYCATDPVMPHARGESQPMKSEYLLGDSALLSTWAPSDLGAVCFWTERCLMESVHACSRGHVHAMYMHAQGNTGAHKPPNERDSTMQRTRVEGRHGWHAMHVAGLPSPSCGN